MGYARFFSLCGYCVHKLIHCLGDDAELCYIWLVSAKWDRNFADKRRNILIVKNRRLTFEKVLVEDTAKLNHSCRSFHRKSWWNCRIQLWWWIFSRLCDCRQCSLMFAETLRCRSAVTELLWIFIEPHRIHLGVFLSPWNVNFIWANITQLIMGLRMIR